MLRRWLLWNWRSPCRKPVNVNYHLLKRVSKKVCYKMKDFCRGSSFGKWEMENLLLIISFPIYGTIHTQDSLFLGGRPRRFSGG